MREKNLVRRRYCKDRIIVSDLFVKVWGGEEGTLKEERRDLVEGKRRNGKLIGFFRGRESMKEEIR